MILYFRSIGANDTWGRKSIGAIIGVLHALVAAHGFRVALLRAIPDPTYLAFNDLFFRMSVLFERMLLDVQLRNRCRMFCGNALGPAHE